MNEQNISIKNVLMLDDGVVPTDYDTNTFLNTNKKTTTVYRALLAQAVGTTGTIPRVVKMAFGNGGEQDEQGNPMPPTDTGELNNLLLTKDLKSVTYPVETSVCFEAEIVAGELTANINEVALIDEENNTVAKMRLLTNKGVDPESGLNFRWIMEF